MNKSRNAVDREVKMKRQFIPSYYVTRTPIATKICIPLPLSSSHILIKDFFRGRSRSTINDVRVTSISANYGKSIMANYGKSIMANMAREIVAKSTV